MVRYHSLVIDPETLPEELIPIAWASPTGTLPFLVSKEHILAEVQNESSNLFCQYDQTRSAKILMGIKHSTRPHYGLQVIHTEQKFLFTVSTSCDLYLFSFL